METIEYGLKKYSLEQAKAQVRIFKKQGRMYAAQQLIQQLKKFS